MAKVTALGWGAAGSNADDPEYSAEQEKKWPGKAGSTSSEKPATSPGRKRPGRPSPAHQTAPRSSTAHGVSFSAGSAATSPKDDK
jgi:hypothetical protein